MKLRICRNFHSPLPPPSGTLLPILVLLLSVLPVYPWWDTTDAEIEIPSAENRRLWRVLCLRLGESQTVTTILYWKSKAMKGSLSKAWGRSDYNYHTILKPTAMKDSLSKAWGGSEYNYHTILKPKAMKGSLSKAWRRSEGSLSKTWRRSEYHYHALPSVRSSVSLMSTFFAIHSTSFFSSSLPI